MVKYYPETQFGGFTNVDGSVAFYVRVNAMLDAGHTVLDVGCGRGEYMEDVLRYRRELRVLRGKCQKVIGIDVDASAAANPYVDEFRIIRDSRWPVETESIDLLLADYVIEHISGVDEFFSESRRVLRRNGVFCLRTTNALSYVGVAARLTPNRHHAAILQHVQDQRQEQDVFPTLYRCNTRRRLRHYFREYGFNAFVCGHNPEPSYLSFSPFAFVMGLLYQRLAPRAVAPTLLAFARRL